MKGWFYLETVTHANMSDSSSASKYKGFERGTLNTDTREVGTALWNQVCTRCSVVSGTLMTPCGCGESLHSNSLNGSGDRKKATEDQLQLNQHERKDPTS